MPARITLARNHAKGVPACFVQRASD